MAIVLLPDAATDGYVRALSHSLADDNAIRLGGPNKPPYPHVSLFHLVINPADIDRLWVSIIRTVRGEQTLSPLRCLWLRWEGRWHFLKIARSADIVALQHTVVEASKRYRQGAVPISWKDQFTPEQAAAYGTYGYPNVGIAWDPHFTYGYIPNMEGEGIIAGVEWVVNLTTLALVAIGSKGMVMEIVASVPLNALSSANGNPLAAPEHFIVKMTAPEV